MPPWKLPLMGACQFGCIAAREETNACSFPCHPQRPQAGGCPLSTSSRFPPACAFSDADPRFGVPAGAASTRPGITPPPEQEARGALRNVSLARLQHAEEAFPCLRTGRELNVNTYMRPLANSWGFHKRHRDSQPASFSPHA